MFNNIIEFKAADIYVDLKQDYPTPIKINIPDWFKKLEHKSHARTVKGCMPFLDTLMSGYCLYVPVDLEIKHNVDSVDKEGKPIKDSFAACPLGRGAHDHGINLNHEGHPQIHNIEQLAGSPLVNKNKDLPFYKILNPWHIKTPPGYSCLFLPPMNNADDRFSIIPGIVDTDTFHKEINFPIVLNGDKYPVLNTTIAKGTPYVQIIPFKRESWKMKITKSKPGKNALNNLLYPFRFLHNYKKDIWKKKQYK